MDREFHWIEDVSRAVQSGVRPTFPLSSPPLYVSLMRDCWNTNPERRPTFAAIVARLGDMGGTGGDLSEDKTTTQL